MPNPTSQVSVAPPPRVVGTRDQEIKRKSDLLKQARVLRETINANRGKVTNGKPDKVYIWVNVHESMRTYFNALGYVPCGKQSGVSTQWQKEDGTHVRGDLILYEVDKDLYDALHLESEIRGLEDLQGSKGSFQSFAAGAGVPVEIKETN